MVQKKTFNLSVSTSTECRRPQLLEVRAPLMQVLPAEGPSCTNYIYAVGPIEGTWIGWLSFGNLKGIIGQLTIKV